MGQPAATCVTSPSLMFMAAVTFICINHMMSLIAALGVVCVCMYVCVDRGTEMRKSCLLRHTARAHALEKISYIVE